MIRGYRENIQIIHNWNSSVRETSALLASEKKEIFKNISRNV